MCRTWLTCLAIVGLSAAPTVLSAQGLTPVKPATGLACMSLDSQSLAATEQRNLPPVLAAQETSAPGIGYPLSIVFVKWPLVEENGYVEMIRLNGQIGWIQASHLQPWHPMNGKRQMRAIHNVKWSARDIHPLKPCRIRREQPIGAPNGHMPSTTATISTDVVVIERAAFPAGCCTLQCRGLADAGRARGIRGCGGDRGDSSDRGLREACGKDHAKRGRPPWAGPVAARISRPGRLRRFGRVPDDAGLVMIVPGLDVADGIALGGECGVVVFGVDVRGDGAIGEMCHDEVPLLHQPDC